MKYVDEYRDAPTAQALITEIKQLVHGPTNIMEICGGHTHAIFHSGIDQVLPPEIRLVHGPGCPVCVTPMAKIDQAITLARRPNTIVATYGDMLRVPGTRSSLMKESAKGAQVKVVYSSLDAVRLAEEHPDQEVVFFAIGFETTIPANGYSIIEAQRCGLKNFSVLGNHVLVPPVIRALLDDPGVQIDAFIGPGHVSTVVGSRDYEFIPREYHRPVVISGFEASDILQSIVMILRQLREGRCAVEVQYTRAVRREGNARAQAVAERVFSVVDQEWRGIGEIPQSGMGIRAELKEYDAAWKFRDLLVETGGREPAGCICGLVVKGVKEPLQCKSFGSACTPERPLGACMVSAEGTCAAYYRYRRAQEIPNEVTP